MAFSSIRTWAEEDRPREKLTQRGIHALTDAELLALLLGSGSREKSAVDLGREMLLEKKGLRQLARCDMKELMKFKGVGEAKAITILAAFEISRRKQIEETQHFQADSPASVADFLRNYVEDLNREVFYVLYLNKSNRLLSIQELFKGGVNGVDVDCRPILKEAVLLLASGMIVCHNHPSGNPTPSQADRAVTQRLYFLAKELCVPLLDHIIVANQYYYSFAEQDQFRQF